MTMLQAMNEYGMNDKTRFPSFAGDDDARPSTTFWADFTVADVAGRSAIIDTWNRCQEWKSCPKYWTELTVVLNHKIWFHYENRNEELARLYDNLWKQACDHAYTFTGEDAKHYYTVTD